MKRKELSNGVVSSKNLTLVHRGWTKVLSGFETSMAILRTLISANHRLWAVEELRAREMDAGNSD